MNHNSQSAPTQQQPRSLYILFLTEMWERFAYFGIQALMVLYLTKVFDYTDPKAYALFGAQSALIFLTPLLGGIVADRILGYIPAIIMGGLLMASGYLIMGHGGETGFFIGLSLLICGNGLLKPNISTLLGTMYETHDARRDSGYTIFYMGINLGALAGVLLCGIVAKEFGWTYAFDLAGLTILLGVLIFSGGIAKIKSEAIHLPIIERQRLSHLGILILGIITTILLADSLLTHAELAQKVLNIVAFAIYLPLIIYGLVSDTHTKRRVLTCLVLIIFSIGFWAIYLQMFMSLTLFTDRLINRDIFGYDFPASSIQSFSGIALIVLAPLFIRMWRYLQLRGVEPNTPQKFALGIGLIGAAYLVLMAATKLSPAGQAISILWLLFAYVIQTSGELSLSPIGLSMVSELAPAKLRGLMMGVWFLATASASTIAGQLANVASVPEGMTDEVAISHIYQHAFQVYAALAIVLALTLALLAKSLQRQVKQIHSNAQAEAA